MDTIIQATWPRNAQELWSFLGLLLEIFSLSGDRTPATQCAINHLNIAPRILQLKTRVGCWQVAVCSRSTVIYEANSIAKDEQVDSSHVRMVDFFCSIACFRAKGTGLALYDEDLL